LLEWLTPDFDGVILFDEAHAMGGVAGGEGRFGATKGSQQGIVGVELQNRLPRARVIYASATGASDVNNLAYATRLGLWGEGTAFPDRTSFIARIREGGIAAMELVARELKAMGVYTARALSYAGVEYDILEHALTPRQIADFDAYADAWAIIHRNLEAALGASGVTDPLKGKTLNGQALSAARSRFESSKQRFFGQLLLSMKLPSLLPAIEEALATDHSVVIQLVSTAEALLDRRLLISRSRTAPKSSSIFRPARSLLTISTMPSRRAPWKATGMRTAMSARVQWSMRRAIQFTPRRRCGSRPKRWSCLARCRRLCLRSMRSSLASAPMPWLRSPAAPADW
jgi:hypothetical protein